MKGRNSFFLFMLKWNLHFVMRDCEEMRGKKRLTSVLRNGRSTLFLSIIAEWNPSPYSGLDAFHPFWAKKLCLIPLNVFHSILLYIILYSNMTLYITSQNNFLGLDLISAELCIHEEEISKRSLISLTYKIVSFQECYRESVLIIRNLKENKFLTLRRDYYLTLFWEDDLSFRLLGFRGIFRRSVIPSFRISGDFPSFRLLGFRGMFRRSEFRLFRISRDFPPFHHSVH